MQRGCLTLSALLAFGVAATTVQTAAAHPPEGEVAIAHNAANQLVVLNGVESPASIRRSIFAGVPGYAVSTIGFENIPFDEPDDDAYVLSALSNISVRLVSVDAGAAIYDNLNVLGAGQSMQMGPPFFDYHPIFSITSLASQPGQVFSFTLIAHDTSGTYTDSDPFTITLTPACVGDANLSGTISVQDIFDFLAAYFQGSPTADVNGVGGVTIQDIFDFLAAYFSPCP